MKKKMKVKVPSPEEEKGSINGLMRRAILLSQMKEIRKGWR